MFSSKKKNVELNLMFISQANNIGNSEIPLVHRIFHKFSRGLEKRDPDVLMKKYSHCVWIGGMVSSQSKWYEDTTRHYSFID